MADSGSVHSTIRMSSGLQAGQRLAGLERRQRALQAFKIEGLFRHVASPAILQEWNLGVLAVRPDVATRTSGGGPDAGAETIAAAAA